MIEAAPLLASQPSVIAGYTSAIARALELRGVSAGAALRAAGLIECAGNDPLERLSADQVTALFKVCVELTGDPCFGLSVARHIHASNIHALGYALMASRTLWDFATRLERYFAIVAVGGHESRTLRRSGAFPICSPHQPVRRDGGCVRCLHAAIHAPAL